MAVQHHCHTISRFFPQLALFHSEGKAIKVWSPAQNRSAKLVATKYTLQPRTLKRNTTASLAVTRNQHRIRTWEKFLSTVNSADTVAIDRLFRLFANHLNTGLDANKRHISTEQAMNGQQDAGQTPEVRELQPISTDQNESPPRTDLIPVQEELACNKFKVFRGRHIQMMALGKFFHPGRCTDRVGVSIGTGVLYESGYHLSIGGPVCSALAYLWAGSILYSVMESFQT
jgi:hypothetical protein